MKKLISFFSFIVYSSICLSQSAVQFIFNSVGDDTTLNSFYFISSCGEPVTGAGDFSNVGFIRPLPTIIQTVSELSGYSEMTLFPNPSQSEIIISSSIPVRKYSVYSTPGILIGSGLNPDRNKLLKISVDGLSSGVYFITLENEIQNRFHKKFVKQ